MISEFMFSRYDFTILVLNKCGMSYNMLKLLIGDHISKFCEESNKISLKVLLNRSIGGLLFMFKN